MHTSVLWPPAAAPAPPFPCCSGERVAGWLANLLHPAPAPSTAGPHWEGLCWPRGTRTLVTATGGHSSYPLGEGLFSYEPTTFVWDPLLEQSQSGDCWAWSRAGQVVDPEVSWLLAWWGSWEGDGTWGHTWSLSAPLTCAWSPGTLPQTLLMWNVGVWLVNGGIYYYFLVHSYAVFFTKATSYLLEQVWVALWNQSDWF